MKNTLFTFLVSVWGATLGVAQPAQAISPASNPPPKIAPQAWRAAEQGAADVIVYGAGYPDLSPARSLITKQAKTQFVFDALTRHANAALRDTRAFLAQRGAESQVLWLINALAVKNASPALLAELAQRDDVRGIALDAQFKGEQTQTLNPIWRNYGKTALFDAQSIEWGVQKVNAPQVWEMGYRGAGIVVAGLDTGINWAHPALKNAYRGWDGSAATHNYNWFDPVALSSAPTWDRSHGSHTIGTVVGEELPSRQIGVAPGAKWIGCRNMNAGVGSVSLYTACFQFALAPTDVTGANPDPSRGADITNNSWGCDFEYGEVGCDQPGALITITQALRDAGVMVVASAGNTGSACNTVSTAPATLDQSFAVGALNSGNFIASFSSNGPSTLTGHVKPNISAPGVSVLSASPSGGYYLSSGTSMASPHVAGVAALLMNAAPGLRGQVDEVEQLMEKTASPLLSSQDCGGTSGYAIPNNTFGYGMVNAQAAVYEAIKAQITATISITAPLKAGFYLSVSNASDVTLTNVTVTAVVPAGMVFDGASAGGVFGAGQVVWQLGSVPPHSSGLVWFGATAGAPGVITLSDYRVTYAGMIAPSAGRGAPVAASLAGGFYTQFLPMTMR